MFSSATPWANLGAKNKDEPGPYSAEVHATRYQYGMALTPERLRDQSRAAKAIRAIGNLRTVAGNHGRFLYDFSPDAIVLRITDDPAPRLLYCFEPIDGGKYVSAPALFHKIEAGDIGGDELLVGVSDLSSALAQECTKKGVAVSGVKAAIDKACERIDKNLGSGA